MPLPFLLLIGSTITLVIVTGVFRLEDAHGKILITPGFRHWLSARVHKIFSPVSNWHPYFGQGFFRLIMHYAFHGILRRCLNLLRRIEAWLERLMRQNRQVAKTIDVEKRQTHLTAIADHKLETALSPREKQRRRSHV